MTSNTVLTYLPSQVTVLATAQITLPARSTESDGRSSVFRCIDIGSGTPTVTLVPAGSDILTTGSPNQTFNQKATVLASVANAVLGIPLGWSVVTEVDQLGLGGASLLNVGTTAGTVAAGDDARFGSFLTSVTATSPLVSSGTILAPVLALSAATSGSPGSMSAADFTKLAGVATGATANTGTVTSVSGTSPVVVATGSSTPVISLSAATSGSAGSLSAADKIKLDASTWVMLFDETLSGAASSKSYTVSGYDNLHLVLTVRSDRVSTSDTLRMTFNSNSGSVYSSDAVALTTFLTVGVVPATSTYTNRQQHIDCRLTLTDGYTKVGYIGRTNIVSTAIVGQSAPQSGGLFCNLTEAITSLQLSMLNANITAGSRIRIMGLKT